jgi:type I restriction enzyme R subunit
MDNEADTCRRYVTPKLIEAGWDDEPHSIAEQPTFTDGRIVVTGKNVHRKKQKRADYLLRYTRDFTLAVVEAKAEDSSPGAGLQQAKEYAEILGLKFAYSTNGHTIIEFDYLTGREHEIEAFPTPDELWLRFRHAEGISDDTGDRLITPSYSLPDKTPRYYQEIAINRAVQAVLQGTRRILLTMATGAGKTFVAFQICWKLWSTKWNRTGEPRRPKILFLADRNVLVDDPRDKTFAAFGDARWKIESGEVIKSREMYFAIYQAIAKDERRPGLYKEYPLDFFDLIIVDECHRGSARDDSNWREILEYFEPAYQIGMTATPKRQDNIDTYRYFGNPIYTYSLRQGLEDGFLAPYRVYRIITDVDVTGWRPAQGDRDRYGREIPDEEYQTKDFERVVALRARTKAIARHLTAYLKKTDRLAKTIVFCVDQEHADEMRHQLAMLNDDLLRSYPDYVCRVTSEEGHIGRAHLSRFQDPENPSPVILTTSQLLTTGVDIQTCKNVVLARVVGSITEFKQIIGRGTRVKDEYGKFYFTILDYTGAATRHFADPEFDGEPELVKEQAIDADGNVMTEEATFLDVEEDVESEAEETLIEQPQQGRQDDQENKRLRKYYFDGGQVEIVHELVYQLDAYGKKLNVIEYTDYTADTVRKLYPTAARFREVWSDPVLREEIIRALAERGVEFDQLTEMTKQPDADPFDLLCHLAYNAPLHTRRERAERFKREQRDFFDQYGPQARAILHELLEKYAEHGMAQLKIPDVLKVPPISEYGNVSEIIRFFGGPEQLRTAVNELQILLYAA